MSQPAMTAALDPGITSAAPRLDRQVRVWLRLEGVAAFVAGAVLFGQLDGNWLWFVPGMLFVDASIVGYLVDARLGAFTYDLAHNWAVGLAVLGAGLAGGLPFVALAGAVLIAHVGGDRALGFGLKLTTGFQDTHLGRIGR